VQIFVLNAFKKIIWPPGLADFLTGFTEKWYHGLRDLAEYGEREQTYWRFLYLSGVCADEQK